MTIEEAREIVAFEAANNEKGQWPEYAISAEGFIEGYEQRNKEVEKLEDMESFYKAEIEYARERISEMKEVISKSEKLIEAIEKIQHEANLDDGMLGVIDKICTQVLSQFPSSKNNQSGNSGGKK